MALHTQFRMHAWIRIVAAASWALPLTACNSADDPVTSTETPAAPAQHSPFDSQMRDWRHQQITSQLDAAVAEMNQEAARVQQLRDDAVQRGLDLEAGVTYVVVQNDVEGAVVIDGVAYLPLELAPEGQRDGPKVNLKLTPAESR